MNQTSMSKYNKLMNVTKKNSSTESRPRFSFRALNLGDSHLLQLAGLKRLHVSVPESDDYGRPDADHSSRFWA